MTLGRAVRTYLDHLAVERGLAVNTLSSYTRDLGRYDEFLAARGIDDLDAISESTVSDFLVNLREGSEGHPPLSATSAARTVVAVRGFHKFAVSDGLAVSDPAAAVKPPTPAKRLPKALPLSDIEAILEAAGAPDTVLALRDRALLELLYGTGARISEAVGLDIDDLDQVDGTALLRGKGGKELRPEGGRRLRGAGPSRDGRRWSWRAGDVPQLPRWPALAPECLVGAGQGGRPRWGERIGVAAHDAALLRHPPPRRRR